ncbi:hypothetical protein [Paraburkholderia guartelaensis]|uniref:DUF3566 domain-containing protein n=1 Tax=Paraburkholderia guartelaensis TaxID=2546446 RepID=A0ABU9SNZ3_9BURK
MIPNDDVNGEIAQQEGTQPSVLEVVDECAAVARMIEATEMQRDEAQVLFMESRAKAFLLLGIACVFWLLAAVAIALTLFSLGIDEALVSEVGARVPFDTSGSLSLFAPGVALVLIYIAYQLTSASLTLYVAGKQLGKALNNELEQIKARFDADYGKAHAS